MPSRRETLIAQNEALFRDVNARRVADDPGLVDFTCECGDLGCHTLVRLDQAEYRAIRANPRRFFVVPDHDIEDVEDVVERHEGHWVVEKPPHMDHVVADDG